MAGDIIPTPANGAADWSDFPVQVEKQRAGFQAISLTHFDDALEPEIAAGSIKEIGSAIAKFDINEPITGWGAIGNDNDVYIKLVPAPPIVTAEFTTDVPVWSHTKQGWYGVGGAATHVYVGGLYKDGAGDYTAKYFLRNPQREKLTSLEITDQGIETINIANGAVAQAKLKTAQSEVNRAVTGGNVALPGGEYGFYPRTKVSAGSGDAQIANGTTATSYTTTIHLQPSGGNTVYAQQRYVTSSGPIKWIFFLRDKKIKQVVATYMAEDHPCYGNGGDPQLLPHPFIDFDSKTQEIVVLNPTDDEWQEIIDNCLTEDRMLDPSKSLWESFCELFEVDEKSKSDYPDIDVMIGLNISDQPVKRRIIKPKMVAVKKIKR